MDEFIHMKSPKDFIRLVAQDTNILMEGFCRYTTNISTRGMAVSMQTMQIMFRLCQHLGPSHILDAGSGFSSYGFRKYQQMFDPDVKVVTVDDNVVWLDRTRWFLDSERLSTEHLHSLQVFMERVPHEYYDIIFYDLGTGKVRRENLPLFMKYRHGAGYMILDDMHQRENLALAKKLAEEWGLDFVELKEETMDEYGRWAGVLCRRK